ncbi:TauD/TfdA family dioxygenase [Streptomyces sp. C11-1]|uniref:TauD/TfdA family dioxygenase n=1 Tax=Streptomyces durocortorensis TaxID=2811104 RepID=A0ABY9W1Y0_9ACTN|nr:TauD/TfdA family dioxygenase [Streptomyces durocortorensis]WNF28022.1 TauD/TfdA family dioxygenase [Streptomyces durocortorensis]
MQFDKEVFPPVVRCAVPGIDAREWAAANREAVDAVLRESGALLLRGFGVTDAETFEGVAGSLVSDLYGDYGDLPHEKDADRVYKSTPYPAEQSILFHHESSHMPQWPSRQFFCCVQPASEGGATPIVDGREVYAALPEDIRARFETAGIRYVRNFIDGLDVGWQDMFGTDDRAEVERRCGAQGVECEWLPDGTLRTRQWAPAVVRHPGSGDPVFFNQLFLHHTACLDDSVRELMASLFGEDEAAFPRSAAYGDGTSIDKATVDLLRGLYDALARRFSWEKGDVVVIDNMLVSHGRDPFGGERKIMVAMGDMVTRRELLGEPGSGRSAAV